MADRRGGGKPGGGVRPPVPVAIWSDDDGDGRQHGGGVKFKGRSAPASKADPSPSPRMQEAGIAVWANDDGSSILDRYEKIKKDVRTLREVARGGSGGPRELMTCTDISRALLMDLQELGYAFSLTLEGEKTAILQLELANLQIAELIRRVNMVKNQRDDAIQQIGQKAEGQLAGILNVEHNNDRELEQTIDLYMSKATKAMSIPQNLPRIAGLEDHVVKMGANTYKIAGQKVTLDFRDKQVFVRVGGGYMEFMQWMTKNQGRISRYIAGNEGGEEEEEEEDGMAMKRSISGGLERRNSMDGRRNSITAAVLRTGHHAGGQDASYAGAEKPSDVLKKSHSRTSKTVVKEKFQEGQTEMRRATQAIETEKERQQQRLQQQLAKKKAANRSLESEVQVSRLREETHEANQALRTINMDLEKVKDDLEKERRLHAETKARLDVLEGAHRAAMRKMYAHAGKPFMTFGGGDVIPDQFADEYRATFLRLDKDLSGTVTIEEMQAELKLDDESVLAVRDSMNRNEDTGRDQDDDVIDIYEFTRWMYNEYVKKQTKTGKPSGKAASGGSAHGDPGGGGVNERGGVTMTPDQLRGQVRQMQADRPAKPRQVSRTMSQYRGQASSSGRRR